MAAFGWWIVTTFALLLMTIGVPSVVIAIRDHLERERRAKEAVPEGRYRIKCSWWRKWLLHRALIWATYGSPRKASLCWRLARVWANEKTEMACAAYCGQLLMMGD